MKDSVVLSTNEVREILSDYFDIPIEDVFRAKYSFVIVVDEELKKNDKRTSRIIKINII